MAGWHHRLDGHESEQTRGESEGPGSLVCCSPWSHKESDTTQRLKNNTLCINESHLFFSQMQVQLRKYVHDIKMDQQENIKDPKNQAGNEYFCILSFTELGNIHSSCCDNTVTIDRSSSLHHSYANEVITSQKLGGFFQEKKKTKKN